MAEVAATTKKNPKKQGGGGRLQKPTLPSPETMKQKVAKLREEINKNSQRIQEIKLIADERRASGGWSESQDLLRQLGDIRGQIKQYLNMKNALRERLEMQEQTKKAVSEQVEAVKEKMKYTSVAEIDKQIKNILDKLNDEDADVEEEEEQRLVARIKQLAHSKEVVSNAKDKIQLLDKSTKPDTTKVEEELEEVNRKMDNLLSQERDLRKRVTKVRNVEAEEVADIPALNEEKQACYEVIVECRTMIKQLQEEYDLEFQEFQRLNQEYKGEQDRIRREREEQQQAERKEREVARRQRQVEVAGAPFSEEILRCDQLIAFLSKFEVQKAKDEKQQKDLGKNKSSMAQSEGFLVPGENMTLVRRKNQMDDDEDDPFANSLSRKAVPKSKKGKKNQKAAAAPEPKKLNLDMDLLMAFSMVKVNVPVTPDEAPQILQQVIKKKQDYKEKQKKALDAMYSGERYIDTDDIEEEKKNNVKRNNKKQNNRKMYDPTETEEADDDDKQTHIQNESVDDEVVKTYINEAYEDENINKENSNIATSSKAIDEEVVKNNGDVEGETDNNSDE